MASDIPYAPFEFTEPGSDEVVGFDVDLAKAIAATQGIDEVQFVRQRPLRRGQPIDPGRGGLGHRAIEDLEGRAVGAQVGTTGADLAATIEGAEVSRFELIDDAFSALAGGRVDAVVNDFATSAYAAEQREGLEIVAQVPTEESYGFVFPKNRPELRDAFNAGLAQVREDGTYDELYRTWFGEDPPAEAPAG